MNVHFLIALIWSVKPILYYSVWKLFDRYWMHFLFQGQLTPLRGSHEHHNLKVKLLNWPSYQRIYISWTKLEVKNVEYKNLLFVISLLRQETWKRNFPFWSVECALEHLFLRFDKVQNFLTNFSTRWMIRIMINNILFDWLNLHKCPM